MPAYRFEALNAAGKTVNGLVEADTPKAARTQLRGQQLVPLKVDPVAAVEGEAPGSRQLFARRVFNATALAIWTRQLSGLVVAGLPLERALTALADEAEDPRQRELVSHLRAEVNAGSTFARALAGSPREFDEVYRGVVAAGEQSGQLGNVLDKLANDLEEQQALTSKLIGATLYPAIVSVFAVVIVVALLVFVVPQVAQVFSSSKRALPFLTQFMLGLSAFMRHSAAGLGCQPWPTCHAQYSGMSGGAGGLAVGVVTGADEWTAGGVFKAQLVGDAFNFVELGRWHIAFYR